MAAEDRSAERWLNAHGHEARGFVAGAVACGCLQALATILLMDHLARALSCLVIDGALPATFAGAAWVMPALVLARAACGLARDALGLRAGHAARQGLRTQLLDTAWRGGPLWRGRMAGGALSSVVVDQVDAVDGYFARYRPQRMLAGIVPFMVLAAVFPHSWAAGLILLVTAPLIPLFMLLVGWRTRVEQTRQMLAMQRLGGAFLDLLRGLPTLRLFDARQRSLDELATLGEAFRERTMKVLRLAFLNGSVLEFFTSVAIAITAVFLGFSLLGEFRFGFYGGQAQLSAALFILLLAPEFYQPLRDLGTHYHARAEALAAAMAIREVIESLPAEAAAATSPVRATATGPATLRLDAVSASYRTDLPVLDGCSLALTAGECVAVVGPSGCGKSTLLRLAAGILPPTAGSLQVDGHELSTLDRAAWREQIAWLDQHPPLLAASLDANLRAARQDATTEELWQALTFAGLGAWAAALPDGLATRLGEGGRPLSGGQLRRLALARLVVRRPRLLLLDEPTASLDADAEAFVIERLAELRAGCTTLLVTHRPAALALADRVLEMAAGRLFAQDGPCAAAPPRRAAASTPHPQADGREPLASRPPAHPTPPALPRLAALRPYRRLLRGLRGRYLVATLLAVVTAGATLGLLALAGWFLSAAAVAGLTPIAAMSFNYFLPSAGVRALALGRTAGRWAERVMTHEATFRLLARLRAWLLARLFPLTPRQVGAHHGSDLLHRFLRDVEQLDGLMPRLVLPALALVAVLGGSAWLLAAWHRGAGLLPLGLLVACGLLGGLAWGLGRARAAALVDRRAEMRRTMSDAVEGVGVLAFHERAWNVYRSRALTGSLAALAAQARVDRLAARLRAAAVVVVGLVAWWAMIDLAGVLDGPLLVAAVLLLLGVVEVAAPLCGSLVELPAVAHAAGRIEAVVAQRPAIDFPARGPCPTGGSLLVEDVAFGWDAHTPVLAGLSLALGHGEHCLLTGPSGCGKSTLVQLLARFEAPVAGRIRLGGVPLEALDEPTLRATLAVATQFAWARGATVADNLRLADPDADAAAMWDVLTAVGLADIVAGWPEGLDTWVQEGGHSLSGGQLRRLGVARALLRRAPLTILDEPTEGLDEAAADALAAAVSRHCAGRTLIWISHRQEGRALFGRVLDLLEAPPGIA